MNASYLAFVETNVAALERVGDLERLKKVIQALLERHCITITDIFDRVLRSPQCHLASEHLLAILTKKERLQIASHFFYQVRERGPNSRSNFRVIPPNAPPFSVEFLEEDRYNPEDHDVCPEDEDCLLTHLKDRNLMIGDPDLYEWMVLNRKATLCNEDHPLGMFLSPNKYWERRVRYYSGKSDFVRAMDELKKARRGLYAPHWTIRDFVKHIAEPAYHTAVSREVGYGLITELYLNVGAGDTASLEGVPVEELITKINMKIKMGK